MKILIAVLFSASVSANTLIAEVRTVTGFTPNPCKIETVSVFDTGEVVRTECDDAELITTLAPQVVAKIQKLATKLADVELVKEDPSAPMCMDAPSTTYGALNAAGAMVAVGGRWGCLEMVYPGHNSNAYRLKSLLQGLRDLSRHF